jgi:hypothetical protein
MCVWAGEGDASEEFTIVCIKADGGGHSLHSHFFGNSLA